MALNIVSFVEAFVTLEGRGKRISGMNSDNFGKLADLALQHVNAVNDGLAVVGLIYSARKIINCSCRLFHFLKTHILAANSCICFKDAFKGEWAVITGSSEGIGKAYAAELAKRGMNLILISKDVRQLQATSLEINEKYGVRVEFISILFDGDMTIYSQINSKLADKKVAILVNNVGVNYDHPQLFVDVPMDKLGQLINVNILPATMMTHIILPGMLERGAGAVVNISAGACLRPTPLTTVYTATKAYLDVFSRSLAAEYADQGIIVQSLLPFYVATRMNKFSRTFSKPNAMIPKADEYARHAVATLGVASRTSGYWHHAMQGWLCNCLPECLWVWLVKRVNHALRRQAQERMRSRSAASLSESGS